MKKVLIVFGTRPEAIKMCPLIKEFNKRKKYKCIVCVTGQHKEMLSQVLDVFNIVPKYNLAVMENGQTLFNITEKVLIGMEKIISEEKPDVVLVHGDTTTTFASALAAFYLGVPVGHVEAGLRTYNIYSPFPEEFNRQSVDSLSSIFFAPTKLAKQRLISEGKNESKIFVTGNTGIDALKTTVQENYKNVLLDWASDSKLVLITVHRRENLGTPMKSIFYAVKRLIENYPEIKVIYPIHMNPTIRELAKEVFSGVERIKIVEPLNVIDFHNILARSYIILTDSGGVQEEAPSLGIPVLVLRDLTERPEGVAVGTLRIVGTSEESICDNFNLLINNPDEYNKMASTNNPYGDGHASKKIVDALDMYI